MKNLTKKQKIFTITILVVIFCIGILIGTFTGIKTKNKEEINVNNEIEKNEKLPETINMQDAINNGYFVIDTKNEKVYNKNILERFIENTSMNAENRVADKIIIASYNMNNEQTIYDLEYKIFEDTYINEKNEKVNKTGYILKIDPSRVSFETSMTYQEQLEAHKIKVIDDIPGMFYGITLRDESEFQVSILSLSLYTETGNPSDEKQYKEIEITRFFTGSEVINNFNSEQ